MLGKLKQLLQDPLYIGFYIAGRCNPAILYRRYSRLAKKAGLRKTYFVLSFDCDTYEDFEVAWDVHSRLMDMNVKPVYAVSGELLRRGEKIYRRIAETGAEFINHGSKEHTYFDSASGNYKSCFFYDQLNNDQIEEDIVNGGVIVKEVLGIEPKGFRTPHFGTFQGPEHLNFLYQVLSGRNYQFSSSTMPYLGFRKGPVLKRNGILEFPVSGMWSRPLNVLDSWNFFRAPERVSANEDNYYWENIKIISYFERTNSAGILNFYADPSHIAHSDIFFQMVGRFSQIARNCTYSDLVNDCVC